jgi:S-adenosylmethionine:tRNA ribosyltransferase-isomerase
MRTDDFDYDLPEELIAQTPPERGTSRMLVLHRDDGCIESRQFADFVSYLRAGDVVVLNDTRVTARRLYGTRESGSPVELLLLRPVGETDWEALVRPGRRVHLGSAVYVRLTCGETLRGVAVERTPEGGRIIRFRDRNDRDRLATEGEAPLPPYIHARLADEERYQTVYAGPGGSSAAPTAGLHFTPEMLEGVRAAGAEIARVTLHVGVDTFRPVKTATVEEHQMHGECYALSPEAADTINAATGRVIAVGTTVVRTLESAARGPGRVAPQTSVTRLFITPGYQFAVVGALLTNFHLPKSTLLMLVSAFATRDYVRTAYETAVREQYRFFSFGDAMLIV